MPLFRHIRRRHLRRRAFLIDFLSYSFYFVVLAVLQSFCADLRAKRQLLAVMRSMPADESLKQDGCYT